MISFMGCFLAGACANETDRTLSVKTPNLGIQNPDLIANDDTLRLLIINEIQNDGSEIYSLEAYLKDARSNGSHWSDEQLLGNRFLLKLGSLSIQMELDPNGIFKRISSVQIPNGSAFMSLHNLSVDLARVNDPQQSIINGIQAPAGSSEVMTPPSLGNYPLNREPLEDRILSNCAPLDGGVFGRQFLQWLSFSSQPILVNYFDPSGEGIFASPIRSFEVTDTGHWQLSPEVFSSYFSTAEMLDLETPNGGAYPVDYKIALQSLSRSSPLYSLELNTIPVQTMKLKIQTIEVARYTLEYEGGCQ